MHENDHVLASIQPFTILCRDQRVTLVKDLPNGRSLIAQRILVCCPIEFLGMSYTLSDMSHIL